MNVKALASACCPPFLRPLFDRIQNSPIGYRLARGVFWSMAGMVSARAVMLVASILVARMLGKEVFGEYGMIRSTVDMFLVFAGFELGATATKHVAEFRQSNPERAGRIIGLSGMFAMITGGLMGLGVLIFAPWLAEHTLNAPHLTGVLRIGAVILLLNALNGAQTGALSGFEAFKAMARVNLLVALVSCPVLVCATWFGGLTGAVWALAITASTNWLFNHIALRKEAHRYGVPFTLRRCGQELPVLWKFSIPMLLATSLNMPVTWTCRALLVNEPNGYSEMGVFNAANQWFGLLLFVPSLLGIVVLPILSERLGQNDTRGSTKTMLLAIKINAAVLVPVVLVGSLASPLIMDLYGSGFRSGWPTLIVSLLTAGLLACEAPVIHVLMASGRIWTALSMNLGWALTFIASTLLLLDLGAFGLATARAVAYLVQCMIAVALAIWILRKAGATS